MGPSTLATRTLDSPVTLKHARVHSSQGALNALNACNVTASCLSHVAPSCTAACSMPATMQSRRPQMLLKGAETPEVPKSLAGIVLMARGEEPRVS